MRSHQHSLMGLKIQASQAPPINGLSILSMSHCEISFDPSRSMNYLRSALMGLYKSHQKVFKSKIVPLKRSIYF